MALTSSINPMLLKPSLVCSRISSSSGTGTGKFDSSDVTIYDAMLSLHIGHNLVLLKHTPQMHVCRQGSKALVTGNE